MLLAGFLGWFWLWAFGDDDACRLCVADEVTFPLGSAPRYVVACENLYCRRHCRQHCGCGAADVRPAA